MDLQHFLALFDHNFLFNNLDVEWIVFHFGANIMEKWLIEFVDWHFAFVQHFQLRLLLQFIHINHFCEFVEETAIIKMRINGK